MANTKTFPHEKELRSELILSAAQHLFKCSQEKIFIKDKDLIYRAASTKFAGGILGYTDPLPDEETGLILENRYYLTGENLGGIDGICYDGATAPMTIEEFLKVENLDDMFRSVTVRFTADGQKDVALTVNLGKTLAVAKINKLYLFR